MPRLHAELEGLAPRSAPAAPAGLRAEDLCGADFLVQILCWLHSLEVHFHGFPPVSKSCSWTWSLRISLPAAAALSDCMLPPHPGKRPAAADAQHGLSKDALQAEQMPQAACRRLPQLCYRCTSDQPSDGEAYREVWSPWFVSSVASA